MENETIQEQLDSLEQSPSIKAAMLLHTKEGEDEEHSALNISTDEIPKLQQVYVYSFVVVVVSCATCALDI